MRHGLHALATPDDIGDEGNAAPKLRASSYTAHARSMVFYCGRPMCDKAAHVAEPHVSLAIAGLAFPGPLVRLATSIRSSSKGASGT